MSEFSIDEYSGRIIALLNEKGENGMRSNELWRALDALKWGSSKSLFHNHLKELVDEKIVEPEKVGKQGIKYRINYSKESKKILDGSEKLMSRLKAQREELFEMPIDKQIEEILNAVMAQKIFEIKTQINIGVNKDSFDNRFELLLLKRPFFKRFEIWMVNKGIEDPAYRKELMDYLEKLIN
jgi:hypothetical protein